MRGAADFISLYERLSALEHSHLPDAQKSNSPGSAPHQPPPVHAEWDAQSEKLLRENALLRQAFCPPRPPLLLLPLLNLCPLTPSNHTHQSDDFATPSNFSNPPHCKARIV